MPQEITPEDYRQFFLEAEIPSIGCAVHGNEVAVLTPQGEEAPAGEIGEICVRGHNVMAGYFDNSDETSKSFRNGWFHTQDMGYYLVGRNNEKFFTLTGRIKNIAKVRGEAVSLEEVDRILLDLPMIKDAACVALPHPLIGDELVAAVVLREGLKWDEAEVVAEMRKHLGPIVIPRRFITLEHIPRSPTGKLRRLDLSALLAQ